MTAFVWKTTYILQNEHDFLRKMHVPNGPPYRLLWTNLGTEQEPDTYIKTALTFSDKPALALALKAGETFNFELRRTSQTC